MFRRAIRFLFMGVFVLIFAVVSPLAAGSYYTLQLDDPKAVYLNRESFPSVRGDGVADDSDAIQQAINRAQETTGSGVVFIPEGKYRLGKTIYVWPGIRVIGYGTKRPTFVLGEKTPGFQEGEGKYMVFFAGGRSQPGQAPRDASAGTFYSAMSNIDLEIKDGNPAAVGIRAHYAQHCFLAHMDIRIGVGRAGLEDIGNEAEDLHFYGGEYGIVTIKPSPGWQFTMTDSSFEGQRQAAIKSEEAGLTLFRVQFKNVPTVFSINPERAELLWLKDGRMENVSGPALIISNGGSPRPEINLENVACEDVPQFASYRESGKKIAGPAKAFVVKRFTQGVHIADMGAAAEIKTTFEYAAVSRLPDPVKSDIPDLPSRDSWVNVRTAGVTGDGQTDDTAAVKAAIAAHRTLYFPSGSYRVTDTLTLKADTVLIGMNPTQTMFLLPEQAPGFHGAGGPPKAMLVAPQGGNNIVTGIGLFTGSVNSRAIGAKWMAGKDSMMNDVRFLGGHGTSLPAGFGGSRGNIYNNNHTADTDLNKRWDVQHYSLWITSGGGGTFKDIWTPDTFAQAGIYISDTSTEGRMYQVSIEHHVRNEVKLRNVHNWFIYSMQTEEERGEGPEALPLEIADSSDITFANLFMYRVISTATPSPYAIKITDSKNIHFRNLHCYSGSKYAFDNSIYDETHGAVVRAREIAALDVSGNPPKRAAARVSPVLAPGAKVEKLAGGFSNATGAAVDPAGNVFFVDPRWQRIFRWSADTRAVRMERDNALDPVNLGFDKAGNLLVVSDTGTVYAFKPGSSEDQITYLEAQAAAPRPGAMALLAANRRRDAHDFWQDSTQAKPYHYLSPDGTVFIPVGRDFKGQSTAPGGYRNVDITRTFSLAPAKPGVPFYVADEYDMRTYSFQVGPDGTLSQPKLFANAGGTGAAADAQGNVYVAQDQILVFDASGKQIDTIDVPERPGSIVFGGKDGQTLFIAARTSVYAVRTKFKGR